jgi:hypothetical protein
MNMCIAKKAQTQNNTMLLLGIIKEELSTLDRSPDRTQDREALGYQNQAISIKPKRRIFATFGNNPSHDKHSETHFETDVANKKKGRQQTFNTHR